MRRTAIVKRRVAFWNQQSTPTCRYVSQPWRSTISARPFCIEKYGSEKSLTVDRVSLGSNALKKGECNKLNQYNNNE